MFDRNDPDLSKKLFAKGKLKPLETGNRRLVYASFQLVQNVNPWIALHDGSITNEQELAKWELTIPKYGCACKRFYAEWKAENKPDFSSPEAFFAWGVRLHNAVNAKLGKPEFTIEEALKLWRGSDGLDLKKTESERP